MKTIVFLVLMCEDNRSEAVMWNSLEFEVPVGLFEFMKLDNYISDLLEITVDLVSRRNLNLISANTYSKKLS